MPQKKSDKVKPKVKEKRKVKPKPKKPSAKGKKYKGPKLSTIVALAFSLGMFAAVYTKVMNYENTYTIAKVKDLEDDEFEDEIPLYRDGDLISTIPEDGIVIVDTKVDSTEGYYQIMTLGSDGELITGITPEEYIDMQHSLTLKMDDERLKYTYEVTGADVVNLRDSTLFEPSSIIGTINEGDLVIGGDRVVASDNDFMWIPVIYVDEEGNLSQGYICYDYLTKLGDIDLVREELDTKTMKVNTDRVDGVDLNLREETEFDDSNIITKIPNHSIITKLAEPDKAANCYKWSRIQYTDEEGNIYEGWVVDSLIDDVELVKLRVDTSQDGKINLNVRKEPSLSSEKIASIEHNTVIAIPKEFIEGTIRDEEDREWVKVKLNDGTSGYVVYSYLKQEKTKEPDDQTIEVEGVISQKELDELINKMDVRPTGNVVGIDSINYTPEELEELLTSKNAIPSVVYYHGKDEYNTEDLAGGADFVFIQIGARGWGEAGNMVDTGDKYKRLAKVCEEKKVPYGFYFYSTALSYEEADEEIDYCKRAINSLDEHKYNLLPLAVDYETYSEKDDEGHVIAESRLIGNDVTDVAAYWLNQSAKYFGETIIYTSPRNMTPGSYDYIIDLDGLNNAVLSGKPKFWICALRDSDDYTKIQGENYYDPLADDINEIIRQTIIDSENDDTGLPYLDINTMQADTFEEMIKRARDEQLQNYQGKAPKDNNTQIASIDEDLDFDF